MPEIYGYELEKERVSECVFLSLKFLFKKKKLKNSLSTLVSIFMMLLFCFKYESKVVI